MGFIKHFDDDMPCTIPDNPNLYFPKSHKDLGKEIYHKGKWYKCYIDAELIGKTKTLESAKALLNAL